MSVRVFSSGRFCRSLCVVLSLAMATGPLAAIAAEAPPTPRTVGEPDTTLLAEPQAGKLDLTYVTRQAVAYATLRPHQLLTSKAVEMLPVEVAAAAGIKYLGIDPAGVDEMVAFVEPPMGGPPGFGLIVNLAQPFDLKTLPEAVRAKTQAGELGGRLYYESRDPMRPSFYVPDDKTLLVAPDATIRRMLESKDKPQASPLLDRVREVPSGYDFYMSVDTATLRPMINAMIGMAMMRNRATLAPEVKPLLQVPDLVSAAELTLNLTNSGPTSIVVRANDAASADKLESILAEVKEVHRKQMAAEAAKMQASDDPIERAMGQYMERMSNVSASSFDPERKGESFIVFHGFQADNPVQKQLITVTVIGILVALILPAIQAAREAARRNQSMNNLKQLVLSLLVYLDVRKIFPAHATYSPEGKPLLSWRVQVLPYLEQKALYDEFHQDEPWDSQHNRTLIARMPEVFQDPNAKLENGKTNYLAVVGKDCIFDGTAKGIGIRQIVDGTSRTVMLVEADPDQAVEWTKPDDWEFDANNPTAGLGHVRPGGWLAAFADGSIRFIDNEIDPAMIKTLFTRNGKEVVDLP